MSVSANPAVAQISARRRERWEVCASDPEFWAWVAADSRRLLREHPRMYPTGARGTLAALAMVADWVSCWRRTPVEVWASGMGASAKPVAHGTASGWQQHKYRGEMPCVACVEAKRVDNARWAARRVRPSRVRHAGTVPA